MKLQLNNSGAWKTLINFPVQETDAVLNKASKLFVHGWRLGDMFRLRVIDARERVTHRWIGPNDWIVIVPREEWLP